MFAIITPTFLKNIFKYSNNNELLGLLVLGYPNDSNTEHLRIIPGNNDSVNSNNTRTSWINCLIIGALE